MRKNRSFDVEVVKYLMEEKNYTLTEVAEDHYKKSKGALSTFLSKKGWVVVKKQFIKKRRGEDS